MEKRFFKGLSVMLILAMLFTSLFFSSVVLAAGELYFGDVDKNNAIDAADALLALQATVQLKELDAEENTRADVNVDGAVNASDALLMLQYSVRLIDKFPAEDSTALRLTTNPWSADTQAYAKQEAETDPGVIRTTFQQDGNYSATDDVPSDSTMVYISLIDNASTFYESWKEKKQNCAQESLDIMTAVGRDNGREYFRMYPERKDYDACKDINGNIYYHPGGTTVPYMCPTRYYREYKLKLIETLCQLGPGFIAVEEPESFIGNEYNEGFKEEWLDYYGTEFVDPNSSAEARYMSSKLMTYLWMTMIDAIGAYMEENYPEIDLVVATHSTANYTHWGIVSAVNAFTSSKYVDGIIGQTWSDTVNSAVQYAGSSQTRVFEAAFTEYATYADSMQEGQTVYALTDAKADDASRTWEDYRNMWEKTLVAELMQQDIHNFQECVWPSRGFTVAPDDYRTVQLAVFNALGEIGGHASTLYAGTPGISLAIGDSLSWQHSFQYYSGNSASLYGITVPLVERGIPVSITSLDYLDSVEDLSEVQVLMLAYDATKPQSEKVNEVVAEWVKEGGTLLYLGGYNDYDTIDTEWWVAKDQTPYENLMEHLGLAVTAAPMEDVQSFIEWKGPAGFCNSFSTGEEYVESLAVNYSLCYAGEGINPILSNDAGAFGFEAAVGKGHVVSVGLPSSYYACAAKGPEYLRDLVRYATTFTNVTYLETSLMTVKRGNYVVSHALDHSEGEILTGNFVDLFDENLPVITSQQLAAGASSFLYDITELLASDMPRLAYTGGTLKSEVAETADTTTFTIGGPTNTVSSTRLLGNGKYPESIVATLNGTRVGGIVSLWDNATNSLLIRIDHTADEPIEITVNWGNTAVEDTAPYEWKRTGYTTGSRNADAGFLFATSAKSVVTYRQSEYDTETVYRFDLDEINEPFFEVDVFGNYLIQVSTNGKDYITLYDYREISETYVEDMKNRTCLYVMPESIGAKSGDFYIRIANTDTGKAYGGAIMKLYVNEKQTITTEK